MAWIAIAMGDVGTAVPVQEALEATGHRVTWDQALGAGPVAGTARFDAVILSEDVGVDVAALAERWRDQEPPPALLLVGGAAAQATAQRARLPFVASTSPPAAIAAAVIRSLGQRFIGRLSPGFARGALGLPTSGDRLVDAAAVLKRARTVDLDLVRESLRWHVLRYATAGAMIAELREQRALEIPEVELAARVDGTRTVGTLVGGADAAAAGRTLWALISVEAVTLSDEPIDLATPARRALAAARTQVRARRLRVGGTTCYDVLEVGRTATSAEIDHACRMLAIRYSPERLGALDLGDLAPQVQPLWEQILKARLTLRDPETRARYDHAITQADPPPRTTWAAGPFDVERAEALFARGQKALVAGEAFKAVSDMAAAARTHPDHPDYEASLAWARYRAELTRGKDKVEAARHERAEAEAALAGRRPWPRALVALALLCAAAEDPEAARWHLREALACDPNLPIAEQLLARLR